MPPQQRLRRAQHLGLAEKPNSNKCNQPDLVIVTPESLDGPLELVRDVELVGVEQEEDSVDALGEPLEDPDELVAAVDALLFAAQDSRSVDDRDAWNRNQWPVSSGAETHFWSPLRFERRTL